MNGSTWTAYYESQGERAPRDLLLSTLDAFGPGARDAIDLGCGTGIETVAILRRGWRVFAVDAEPVGVDRLLVRASPPERERLDAQVGSIEDVELPSADLVWAGYSLFFVPPQRFATTWRGVRASVRPGGRFAGQLLGERDTWAAGGDVNAHRRADAEAFFDGWTLERFDEEENDGDACSGPKHWHLFHVVARAPGVLGPAL
jgi:SAM-dependent methyltransferase